MNNRDKKTKLASGFTLLEVMVSLGILSIIFTLLYATFNNVFESTAHMEIDADRYRLARTGMYYLTSDLSMTYDKSTKKTTNRSNTQDSSASNTSETLVFLGTDGFRLDKETSYANDTLEFSMVSPRNSGFGAAASDRAIVRYSLQDKVLIQEASLSNGGVRVNELGGPIEGLSFRYYDEKTKTWLDEWDAGLKDKKAPRAVEIEFIMQGRQFKTWVDIPIG